MNLKSKIHKTNFYIGDGLKSRTETYTKKTFDSIIPEYYPDFTDINEFYKQFMKSSESIFILSGESGTGKSKFFSYMLKHLIDNPDLLKITENNEDDFLDEEKNIKVAYVKDKNILCVDQFWITLNEQSFDIVILDDLDNYLAPRGEDSNEKSSKFISQLISYTDGIVKNKTKFLISTNKEISSIDSAILRDGRLFGIFSFSRLSYDEAKTIWIKEGLNSKLFSEEFEGDKAILQSRLGSIIEKLKSNNGAMPISFIKEGSIMDIAKKYQEKKRGLRA